MKAYIHSYRTISRIDSFEKGILESSSAISDATIHPDYKEIISAGLIRRMNPLIRMGVGAAIKVKQDLLIEGIIVGTGLGLLENTEKFLSQFIQNKEGMLSPTSFIQSTHNTIAGQIGLILKDNCYNSTYTQRGQSFENALIDAVMLSQETNGNILVGGLDEKIPLLDELANKIGLNVSNLAEGASFFIVNQNKETAKSEIKACKTFTSELSQINQEIKDFLATENLGSPDLILEGASFPNSNYKDIEFESIKWKNYSAVSGEYMTNSAFGLQMASELIETNKANSILILNNFSNTDFGLTYIQKP